MTNILEALTTKSLEELLAMLDFSQDRELVNVELDPVMAMIHMTVMSALKFGSIKELSDLSLVLLSFEHKQGLKSRLDTACPMVWGKLDLYHQMLWGASSSPSRRHIIDERPRAFWVQFVAFFLERKMAPVGIKIIVWQLTGYYKRTGLNLKEAKNRSSRFLQRCLSSYMLLEWSMPHDKNEAVEICKHSWVMPAFYEFQQKTEAYCKKKADYQHFAGIYVDFLGIRQ